MIALANADHQHAGIEHPGTPLEVLKSANGFYVGHLDEDGCPYSRESGYFDTEDLAEQALEEMAPHKLERLASGRYLCHIKAENLMVSVELFDSTGARGRDYSFAVIEVTRYQMRVNDDCLGHDLIEHCAVPPCRNGGLLGAAVIEVERFLKDRGLGRVQIVHEESA